MEKQYVYDEVSVVAIDLKKVHEELKSAERRLEKACTKLSILGLRLKRELKASKKGAEA